MIKSIESLYTRNRELRLHLFRDGEVHLVIQDEDATRRDIIIPLDSLYDALTSAEDELIAKRIAKRLRHREAWT